MRNRNILKGRCGHRPLQGGWKPRASGEKPPCFPFRAVGVDAHIEPPLQMDVKYSMEASSRPSRPGAFFGSAVSLRGIHIVWCLMVVRCRESTLPRKYATQKKKIHFFQARHGFMVDSEKKMCYNQNSPYNVFRSRTRDRRTRTKTKRWVIFCGNTVNYNQKTGG